MRNDATRAEAMMDAPTPEDLTMVEPAAIAGRFLARPLGLAAYALFYALMFGVVVMLPLALVLLALMALFG